MGTGFFDAVRSAIGTDSVDTGSDVVKQYGRNRLPGGDVEPAGVITPASAAEVATIVRLANEHQVSLWPTSTGQNIGLGGFSPVRSGQVVLHLGAKMNHIVELNEELGYAVVQPGVTFEQLRAELRARGDGLMMSTTSGPPHGSIVGNAMDRGAGYTPYFNHFGALCGMEVVLPDGTMFYPGDGTLRGSKTRFTSKAGFGPVLDGMFTQANYGVVTEAAIWLMRRPPAIEAFAFSFLDDDDLAEIIDLIRPLQQSGSIPTLMKVTSDVYGFATQEVSPAPSGAISEEQRRELRRRHNLGAWLVSGALYGSSPEELEPALSRIRAHFEASGKATYVSHNEMAANPVQQIHLDTFTGEPTSEELGMLNWRPGSGMTWFLPTFPMLGQEANELHQVARGILNEHGFDYSAELACGPRVARGLHPILFNREDAGEVERMNQALDMLVARFDDLGYPISRVPTDRQEWAMSRLPELSTVTRAIKGALDPNGVIAPGKYGI